MVAQTITRVFVLFVETADKESWEGCHGRRFCIYLKLYYLFIYGVYYIFIVRRALATWARVRGLDYCADNGCAFSWDILNHCTHAYLCNWLMQAADRADSVRCDDA